MADRWLKNNCLLASATAFWLTALSPLPQLVKAVSYGLALVASVQLVQESQRLIIQDARRAGLAAMNEELEDVEIALHTQQQEEALREVYGVALAYPPEVRDELTKSLEHLYREPSAEHNLETSTSTSTSTSITRDFYLAVKSLLEVKGETFVLENILHLSGGQWAKGKQRLQQILEQGEINGW